MVIKITQSALKQLTKISKPEQYVKLYVSSGGCNGIQWNLQHVCKSKVNNLDEKVNEHLVVDGMSVFHLVGSILDYSTSLKASEFIIDNPNANSACGCGKSFSID